MMESHIKLLDISKWFHQQLKYFLPPLCGPSHNSPPLVDGSVSSLLEHCLGWRHEDQAEDGGRAGEADAGHPLLRYLASAPRPAPRHLQLLAAQHGCPALALHTLLSCPAPAPALAEAAAALLEAGARLDARDPAGNTPLLCVARLLERGAWESAATLATMFCARPDCDVNSGAQSVQTVRYSILNLELFNFLTYSNCQLFM